MDLWHAWNCPYCMRVRAALAEKKVPYRSILVDLGAKPPGLLALNPKGGVPVLVDGGTAVVESLSILEYLDSRWPEPSLFVATGGRDAVKEAYERVNAIFAPRLPKVARGTPEERTQALAEIQRALEGLDAGIPASGFLLGDLSAADLALASFVAKLPTDRRPAALGLEGWTRWERAVMDRPSVRDQMAARAAG
jgi:glutathione S-transferase